MKNFFETLKNIFSIKELRERILYTLLLLAIFRLGSYIILPGVNPDVLSQSTGNASGLLGLINSFTGGAFNKGALFALGVMPYISASIIVQLLGFAVPYFQRLQSKEGESGRKKLSQITRLLTIVICVVQSIGYITFINSQEAVDFSLISQPIFTVSAIFILTAGTMFAMWMGEKITDAGIGNGISLLIMVGIIASLPASLFGEYEIRFSGGNGGILAFIIELIVFFGIIVLCVLLIQAVRNIPVSFAKRMVGRSTTSLADKNINDTIPVKVIAAGVMPIIFAQAIMFLPSAIASWLNGGAPSTGFMAKFSDIKSLPYNLLFFILIVLFTYIYTALIVNPKQYSDYLKSNNAFIPGIQPGQNTEEYIDNVVSRITLPGAIFLGLISILPAFAIASGINTSFALFFGGTSILILVGVVLDTLRQVETYLVKSKYDGLIKSGKIGGKKSNFATIGSSV